MEKRLCYCRSCNSFFIIAPGSACPKCGAALTSSVVTEDEWNRSSMEQRNIFKYSLRGTSFDGASSNYGGGHTNYSQQNTGYSQQNRYNNPGTGTPRGNSTEVEKKLKSYRTWSIVIGVIGILSIFSTIGQFAQVEAQGYIVDKTPMYLIIAFSVFAAAAGFYGMGVPKQPSRLSTSWTLFIIILIAMVLLAVTYQAIPGWLCALGCAINIFNGNKLRKMI